MLKIAKKILKMLTGNDKDARIKVVISFFVSGILFAFLSIVLPKEMKLMNVYNEMASICFALSLFIFYEKQGAPGIEKLGVEMVQWVGGLICFLIPANVFVLSVEGKITKAWIMYGSCIFFVIFITFITFKISKLFSFLKYVTGIIKNKLFISKSNEKIKMGTSYLISIVGFLTAMQSIMKIIHNVIVYIYQLTI
jgi:hypothetical protein